MLLETVHAGPAAAHVPRMSSHLDPRPTEFTSTVEAQHAETLRHKRDLTDEEIRGEFWFRSLSDVEIAAERAKDTYSRGHWARDAAERAVASVVNRAVEAYRFASFDAEDKEWHFVPGVDLEGATINISITDLHATAVLTLGPAAQAAVEHSQTPEDE